MEITKRRVGMLFTLPAFLFYMVFLALPILFTLALSVCKWSGYNFSQIKFNGLDNYISVFSDVVFLRALLNTFIFVIVRVVFLNLLGILGALVIDSKAPGRNILKTIIFIPCLLSSVIIGVMWSRMFDAFGILNVLLQRLGIIELPIMWLSDKKLALITIIVASIWQWTGFNVLMYYAGLQTIPCEFYEAATMDGASYWQATYHITIPQLRPIVTISVLWNLIGGFKVYDVVAIMTGGGPNHATEVLATYLYRSAFEINKMGPASVVAIVIVVLCIIASVVRMKLVEE
ncbi:MAG: sugar ABC transporter permease [Sphaerochaetaceae bacterium]|nr:sugar ABC transporter permease [Sphaerochaetaceae bacterium]